MWRSVQKKKIIKAHYTISGTPLVEIDHHPYHGAELSHDLSWGTHKDMISTWATKILNMLCRSLGHVTPEVTSVAAYMYKGAIWPHLEYASAWDPHQVNHIQPLERVQNRAACFVKRTMTGNKASQRWNHHWNGHHYRNAVCGQADTILQSSE